MYRLYRLTVQSEYYTALKIHTMNFKSIILLLGLCALATARPQSVSKIFSYIMGQSMLQVIRNSRIHKNDYTVGTAS
jgi:hypothetical protein